MVVGDDPAFARLLQAELTARGHATVRVASMEAARERMAVAAPKALVLTLPPDMDVETFLWWPRTAGRDLPVVVVTADELDPETRRPLEELGVAAVLVNGSGIAKAVGAAVEHALTGGRGAEHAAG